MKIEEIIYYNDDARSRLKSGISKVAKAVGSTMGPCGQNVIIGKEGQPPKITKDGITVAREITLKDPVEQMAAEIVKQAASQTVEEVGDGTTTCTVLTNALIQSIPSDLVPYRQNLVNSFQRIEKLVISRLEELAKPSSPEDIKKAALISSNGDEELATVITDLILEGGKDLPINIVRSAGNELKAEVDRGYVYDKGYPSILFVNNDDMDKVVLEQPKVIIVEGRIESFRDLVSYFQITAEENFVIIADDWSKEAIASLTAHEQSVKDKNGKFHIVPLTMPDFGSNRAFAMQDLEALTGAKVHGVSGILKTSSYGLPLGQLEYAESQAFKTILRSSKNNKVLKNRIKVLEGTVDNFEGDMAKRLKARIANLKQLRGTIYVTAGIAAEVGERFDRADDAVGAAKAAVTGIIPGGGIALARIGEDIIQNEELNEVESLIIKTLVEPYKTIFNNRGIDNVELETVVDNTKLIYNSWMTLNVTTLKQIDSYEKGIVDPLLVTKTVIKYAFSAALQILTTGCALQSGFIMTDD